MKFLICFAFLAAFVAYSQAQALQICFGRPARQKCTGGLNEGYNNIPRCALRQQQMWYYNSNTGNCESMTYGGCGGNQNRFCSLNDCLRRCTR